MALEGSSADPRPLRGLLHCRLLVTHVLPQDGSSTADKLPPSLSRPHVDADSLTSTTAPSTYCPASASIVAVPRRIAGRLQPFRGGSEACVPTSRSLECAITHCRALSSPRRRAVRRTRRAAAPGRASCAVMDLVDAGKCRQASRQAPCRPSNLYLGSVMWGWSSPNPLLCPQQREEDRRGLKRSSSSSPREPPSIASRPARLTPLDSLS